jgi:hypothetical protein
MLLGDGEAPCAAALHHLGQWGGMPVEYEEQGDGVEGSKKIMEQVLAAL